jgi:hypothetical protein
MVPSSGHGSSQFVGASPDLVVIEFSSGPIMQCTIAVPYYKRKPATQPCRVQQYLYIRLEVTSDDENDVHLDDQQNNFGDNSDDDVIFSAPGVQLVPPPSEEESLNVHLNMEIDNYEMEDRTSGESGVGKLFQL